MKVIFALGNPGLEYKNTRHNVGFRIVGTLAKENDIEWTKSQKFNAQIAEFSLKNEKILLIKPATYYNEVGVSAKKIVDFYKIDLEKDFLAIHDDMAMDFGKIRIRQQGRDAGNNGIKSLNNYIGEDYSRIRIGTNNTSRNNMDDSSFVLSKFNSEEETSIDEKITPEALKLIDNFIKNDFNNLSLSL